MIEAVHSPNHALDKHDVLIQRDQLAENVRREPRRENRRRRTISREHPVHLLMCGNAFGHDLGQRLSECQGLALRKQVRHQ